MGYDDIVEKVIPRLAACRVDRVTLTGGELTIHPEFLDVVRAFRRAGMGVGVCTYATTLNDEQIAELAEIGGVHCNVSLDGFRPESHGRFRGDRDSFHATIFTIEALAKSGLLQGLLCTPNSLAEDVEYRQLCQFAVEHGAEYVLMNPLSSMGRGVKAGRALAATEQRMLRIHQMTDPFDGPDLDVVRIRFPSSEGNLRRLRGRQGHLGVHPRRGDRVSLPGLRCEDSAVAARPSRVHRRQHPHQPRHRGAPR
ncbi:MAG TPA: radical SAM protein [Pseudonocardiaceae bacterium]|nr:radical SAM protein [Pseudonocardiaceae bacterium]